MKNGKPPSHTDRARQLANELEDLDWDEDSSVTTTIVDAHGRKMRVTAPSHSEIELAPPSEDPVTKPDHPAPSSVAAPAKGVGHVLDRVKTWQHVIALGFVLAFLGWAITQGLRLW